MTKLTNNGFTFIELIIVATIIGILAAIAIPNFLQAQIRAKTSRAIGEQEMLLIALQSYYVDKGMYPLNTKAGQPLDSDLLTLTTPIAYISRLPKDPFEETPLPQYQQYSISPKNAPTLSKIQGYRYVNYLQMSPKKPLMYSPQGGVAWFVLMSPGPDYKLNYDYSVIPPKVLVYNPTNGTTSGGDVYVFGP